MVYIILYLVGGLLFVNGLFLLGIATNLAGVAAFNFLGGTLITVMAIYIACKDMYSAFGETVSNVVAATCLTFSIAYLMIGLEGLSIVLTLVPAEQKANFTTLGWYCLPMSICLFILFLGWFQIIGKKMPKVPQFGILWLSWSICFFLFWVSLGLAKTGWYPATGWFIIIVGFITCSYPALANFQAGKVGQW
jgi:putative amide transporter protein